MMNSGNDVVSFLKGQHQQVKALLEEVTAKSGKERERAFATLQRLLMVHEAAEEEVVHPAARRAISGGEQEVNSRLKEENEAKKALTELDRLDVDSSEFETKFAKLKKAVIAHAEAEEHEEFDRLKAVLDPERLQRMRQSAQKAEAAAAPGRREREH
jgi:hemerythrin superfamily protein